MTDSAQLFQDNKFLVVKNLLNQDLTTLLYSYCITTVQRADYLQTYHSDIYNEYLEGIFNDGQAKGYGRYGDPLMDTVLSLFTDAMSVYTGLELLPNYTYWRLYEHGSDLKKHVDRLSCEISVTICLGEDNSMVDTEMYPDYHWPIFVESNGQNIPVPLEPGDALIYKGTEVPHWREPFKGTHQAQLFMHYNDKNTTTNNVFDGRPLLGVPKT